jgi:hypothetical protein
MDAPSDLRLLLSEQFHSALAILLTAFDYAQDSGADRWQFALELPDLLARGAALPDLRWLLLRNFAEHAKETTTPGDRSRSFRPLAPTSFPPDTCLTLTPAGAAALRPFIEARGLSPFAVSSACGELSRTEQTGTVPVDRAPVSPAPNPPQSGISPSPQPLAPSPSVAQRPTWDPLHRELRYAGQVIKRYRVPAPNQELILSAFQEEGWPEYLDDPLPPKDEIDPKQRLLATIKSLNHHQLSPLIRFHGNGNGLQVFWEPVQPDRTGVSAFGG